MATLKVWVAETRPQFLLLTPVCVFARIAASLYDGISFNGRTYSVRHRGTKKHELAKINDFSQLSCRN